ncbi:MAG: SOS response-associated peptidase family protein [Candidatus Methylomirabilota bacterium]
MSGDLAYSRIHSFPIPMEIRSDTHPISRACLILADGSYEWQRQDRRKQPFCIRLGVGRPFA